jgi:uncharacterized damage-inducible protein DinB
MIYGGKDLAESFRTVRKNTLQIAEDIPEEKYSYRATPDVQTIGEELAHIAAASTWQQQFAADGKSFMTFEDFGTYMGRAQQLEKTLTSKAQIVEALRKNGESFASFLENLSEAELSEQVSFPPPVQPSSKTRFEMLMTVKEHEMHHRAKLMLMQRLIGQVPHLTKRRMEMQAAAAAGAGAPRA